MILNKGVKVNHLYPENMVSADISEFEGEKEYFTQDSFLYTIGKAIVIPDSIIYKNGIVLKDNLAEADSWKYYQFKYFIKKILTNKYVSTKKNQKYLLITDNWSVGHFHWFCDVLQKVCSAALDFTNYTLLITDFGYYRNVGMDTLKRLNVNFKSIEWLDKKKYYGVNDLSFISSVSSSGKMNPSLMKQIQNAHIKDDANPNDLIYISRAKAGFRKIVNESELISLLLKYNFRIVSPEGLSFDQQISLFNKAKILISIHGAGLTNCIFMKPGSKVVELRRKENGPSNVGYWHLASALDHKYYYYNATPDSDLPLVGRGCNLTVDLKDFEEKILKKIC